MRSPAVCSPGYGSAWPGTCSISPRTARRTTRRDRLIVSITQQELADAVGTVREVVVRVLAIAPRRCSADTRDGIIIIEPARLIQGRG
jgi:hypothetical protein